MAKLIIGNSTATPIRVIKEQVPMPHSVIYPIDENGKMQNAGVIGETWPNMDMTGVADLGDNVFREQTSGRDATVYSVVHNVDLSGLTKITGGYALYYTFYKMDGSNIEKIDFSNLQEINGNYTCYYTFNTIRSIHTGQEIELDFSSLKSITSMANYTCYYMFANNYDIHVVNMPELVEIKGQNTARNMFACCGDLEVVSLESLETIGDPSSSTCAYNMFGGKSSPTGTTTTYSALREIYLPSLKNIYGGQYMFSNCPYLEDVVFGSSELYLYNSYGIFMNCIGLQSIDFMDSVETLGFNGASQMFSGCTGLSGDIHLRNLSQIIGDTACDRMFEKNDYITSITFDSLHTINGINVFKNICNSSSLTDLYFPNLCFIEYNSLQNILSGNQYNVTLHFAANMCDDEIFQNIINIVGGTETVVLFDLPAIPELEISLPNNISHAIICYKDNWYEAFTGQTIHIKTPESRIYFPVTAETTDGKSCYYLFEYDKDIQGLSCELTIPNNMGQLSISSDKQDGTFGYVDVAATDPNGNTFMQTGWNFDHQTEYTYDWWFGENIKVTIYSTSDNPQYTLPYEESIIADGTDINVIISYPIPETLLELDSSNFENYLTFSDGNKWYLEEAPDDSGDVILRIHQEQNISWQTMQSIPLTIPEGINTIRVSGYANADSENNYDFGYIAIDDGSVTRTYSQIKNWNAGGELIMKDSGPKGYDLQYFETDVPVSQFSKYNPLMLSIGYGQDATLKGTNSFYIKNIKVVVF